MSGVGLRSRRYDVFLLRFTEHVVPKHRPAFVLHLLRRTVNAGPMSLESPRNGDSPVRRSPRSDDTERSRSRMIAPANTFMSGELQCAGIVEVVEQANGSGRFQPQYTGLMLPRKFKNSKLLHQSL